MADNTATRAGNITRFQIYQAKNGGESVDMSAAAVDIRYYENVLSNSVSATAVIVETGFSDKTLGDNTKPVGIIDGLPIRGGEQVILEIEDKQKTPNKLSFNLSTKLLFRFFMSCKRFISSSIKPLNASLPFIISK